MTNAMSSALHQALQHLEDGQREPALAALLDAWRTTRAAEIADVVDRLSDALTELLPPIRAVGATSARKAWLDAAAEGRPEMLGRLLEVLADGNDRCARLRTLLAFPPDPRLGTRALQWIDAPPVHGRGNRNAFFSALIEVLAHAKDPRTVPRLSELAGDRRAAVARLGMRAWKPLVACAAALAEGPAAPLDAAARTTLDRISALLAAPTRVVTDPKLLFESVYRAPDDDEARAVLGDLLQQLGDPRGEFIALQLARHGTTKKRTARERALEQTWSRAWLGALEPVVLKGGVVFERGFVTHCRFKGDGRKQNTSGAEEWSTVTHLDVGEASKYTNGSERLLGSGRLVSLRSLVGANPRDLPPSGTAAWEELGLRVRRWAGNAEILRAAGPRYPAVRTLRLIHPDGEELATTAPALVALLAAWPCVDDLDVHVAVTELAHLVVAAPSLRRIGIHPRQHRVTFDREAKTLAVRMSCDTARHAAIAALLPSLGAGGARAVDHLRIDHGFTMTSEEALVELRAAAAAASIEVTFEK